mgnify:CR=1 FL=1
MSKQFDVIVIGGGPGGYIGAIRAAQLGFNVACIDEWKNDKGGPAPGGTCTNVGCIPSKALLQSSEHFDHASHHFADHGISVGELKMDVAKMIARKDAVVKQNNDGILYLLKKNKVSFFHGRGSFVKAVEGGYEIAVAGEKAETLVGKHIIVATGSNARALPGTPFDEKQILSNDGALAIGDVPKKLGVIGSGVIGLEMGSVWRRLGAEVTILEGLPTFLGAVDEQIAKEAKKAFDKQGLKIELGVKVGEIVNGKKGVTVNYTNAKGEAVVLDADKLIVSIGRVPNTIGLNADAVGLKLDAKGAIRPHWRRLFEQLQRSRNLGTQIMDEVAKTVPAGVYLVSMDKKFNRLLVTGKSESNNRLSSLLRVIEQSPLLTQPVLEFIQASKEDSGLLSDFKMHLGLVGAEAPPPPPEPKGKAGAVNKTGASK